MNTPDMMQRRLQEFLLRFDKLADVVGSHNANSNETVREVLGLLELSAEQCGVAAAILDMAENVGFTLKTQPSSPHSVKHNLANPHRQGRMVVVPGFGEKDFNFPDVDKLVQGALSRLSGAGDQRRDRSRVRLEEPVEDPMVFILGVTKLDEIMRIPPEEASSEPSGQPKTPTRDLLHGGTSDPQVCYLRDAEELVEQTPSDAKGVRVVEFVLKSKGSLPDALLESAQVFLGRAEQILAAAEKLWLNHQPPAGAAVAIPTEEKPSASAS